MLHETLARQLRGACEMYLHGDEAGTESKLEDLESACVVFLTVSAGEARFRLVRKAFESIAEVSARAVGPADANK